MNKLAIVLIIVACVAAAVNASVVVNRADTPAEDTRTLSDPICSTIYTINLEPQLTSQGNDVAMAIPHGIDTSGAGDDADLWKDHNINPSTIGGNYINEPFADDNEKQAMAKAKFSVTALTEPTATPIGFANSTLRQYRSVCVKVRGVGKRWVEIMAQTTNPNQQICVQDWKPDAGESRSNLEDNPFEEDCGKGHLYVCRNSPNEQTGENTWEDFMNVRFYCRDSCDDEVFNFYWRITASQEMPKLDTKTNKYVQPDGEDWCMTRRGDDYPSSLLTPYPADYVPPVVFSTSFSSASTVVVSLSCVLLAILAMLL